jgi:hypothetical protein
MARRKAADALVLAPDGLPKPLRWRLVVQPKALAFGALVSLGGLLLLQQLGAAFLTVRGVVESLALGIAVGILVPTLGDLVGVLWANTILRRERTRREQAQSEAQS